MTQPRVDVVIPTLNSSARLQRCLSRIRAQEYSGDINVIVVDGGSSDDSTQVARSFGASVVVRDGAFVGGKNGARNLGNHLTNSEFLWLVDSDNYVVEPTALDDLVGPLKQTHRNLSVPEVIAEESQPLIAKWLCLRERREVDLLKTRGTIEDGYYHLPDIDFGITNATLLRRTALDAVGGYDSDVRVLMRMRQRALSAGAIVPSAHYVHDTARNSWEFRRKQVSRITRFSRMTDRDLADYFVEYPIGQEQHDRLSKSLLSETVAEPARDILSFVRTGDITWLYGLAFPLLGASMAIAHPVAFHRMSNRYL